jgi:transcriptional regulator with XRE-family HTH domain
MIEDRDAARRQEIASRVIYWMNCRGFTRKLFADRLGKSVSWVDKVKSGDRQLDRLSVLEHIADVLDVDLHALLDAEQAAHTKRRADDAEIDALQEALQRYDGICGTLELDQPPNFGDSYRTLHYCWTAFQASSYRAATRLLPDFLVTLQQTYRGASDVSARERAADYLIQAYWLGAEIAFKLGRTDLGWLAADRGIAVAEWTGDLALIGATARRLVHALMAASDRESGRRAVALVTTTAARLDPELGVASPALLSAYGALFLKGSIAAARIQDASLSRDFNNEAANAARLLGGDRNEHHSAFGPTNVVVHRVSALADMQEGGRVVEEARSISKDQLATLPRERRANHLLDVARGFNQWGKRDEAIRLVLEADNLAREEVRCRPLTHKLVLDLVRGYPRGALPITPLARIAREIGIQV